MPTVRDTPHTHPTRLQRAWRFVAVLLFAGALFPAGLPAAHAAPAGKLPALVYTQFNCVGLYSQPLASSPLLASAIAGTGLRVTGTNSNGQWYHALFLGTMPVWVQVQDVAPTYQTAYGQDNACPFENNPVIKPTPVGAVSGPFPLHAGGTITQYTELRSAPSPSARITGEILPGERATVTQWMPDANGDVWYLAHVQGTLGWVWAYALLFDGPDPATAQLPNGQPVWSVIAGKGLWFTDYLPRHTDIHALVAAAKALGVTHIYPRVAETSYGFFDQESLSRLLPVAHAAGIKVIAWVFPYLYNVGSDLVMTQQVVSYHTPNGDHADGIIADIEDRTDAPAVYAYGQVVRQMVGSAYPLIISTFNPRARMSYPFPEAAASFNVISPQDYWHNSQSATFDAASPRQLLTLSITTIRAELGGKNFPIEEDGQMYDMFTYGEPGGNQPSAAEITGDMQAAKDLGCTGVSFFDWRTASPDELDAFKNFTW